MRTQGHWRQLLFALVRDPGVDEVLREHAALQEEVVVCLKLAQHSVQGHWQLRDALRLLWRKLVQVLVHGLVRLDLVADAVKTGH